MTLTETIAELRLPDLDELERVARAATPGPWYITGAPWFGSADGVLAGSPDGNVAFLIADCASFGPEREEYEGPFKLADAEDDAAHIATFDPPTTLALIARLRTAEAQRRADKARIAELEAGLRETADELQGRAEGYSTSTSDVLSRAARLLAPGRDET